jgi:hypothetical protein
MAKAPIIRYVLCPGTIVSAKDGDVHFINAHTLAQLYGVRFDECVVYPAGDQEWHDKMRNHLRREFSHLPWLHPRYDGNYTLPRRS